VNHYLIYILNKVINLLKNIKIIYSIFIQALLNLPPIQRTSR